MAQANSVREPSMDEILASIRRIIESNDPVPSPGLATTAAEPAGFSGEPANDDSDLDDDEDVHLTVDDQLAAHAADMAARHAAEFQPPGSVDYIPVAAPERIVPTMDEPAPRPLSLADVAARVRAASERQVQNLRAPVPAPDHHVAPINPLVTGRMAQAARPEPVDEQPVDHIERTESPRRSVFGDERPVGGFDASALAETMSEAAVQHLSGTSEPTPSPSGQALVSVIEGPADTASVEQPLVSVPVGDQVARSFNDLALVVEMAERRSFDEIATELMRPMLQEWLDDNLPTLVERLVREEIERVARGPRR